jgi:dienelactone hydrolase
MSPGRFCLLLIALIPATAATAQSTARVESGDSHATVTVWAAAGTPLTTVLLLPGWGGGPVDALGIGRALAPAGISTVLLNPRGWHESGGGYTWAKALEDIGAALAWIRNSPESHLTPSSVVLGGYSWGGGMALAYAARDPSVTRVFSVAGTDHAHLIRQCREDSALGAMVRDGLLSSAAPQGPIRFDPDEALLELAEDQLIYGLLENAHRLAHRSILLFGGWEDENVTVDATLLPLYRLLRKAGGEDVTFRVYHTDHGFRSVRSQLHGDLMAWIGK